MSGRVRRLALVSARVFALATLVAASTACGPAAYRWDAGRDDPREDRVYVVRRGDTLYSIAWRYGLDYRDLARRNGIGDGYLIYPGQKLALIGTRAASTAAGGTPRHTATEPAPEPMPAMRGEWRWPADGPLLAKFGDANATGKGIAIGGQVGAPISAAADGRVVYAGSGLIGYGKIIIVKHSEEYLSAYGHNETIFVREGEQVKQGDRIAAMGRGPGNQPLLHFEIRHNGKAVDPLQYLPSR